MQTACGVDWLALHRALPWEAFQIGALAAGAALVGRGNRAAFALGAVCAAIGGVLAAPGHLEVSGMGAMVGLLVGYALVTRGRRLDALGPAIAAMIVLARLGCFCAGCDFGTPTTSPFAIRYPPLTPAFLAQRTAGLVPADAAQTLPVHPTQLYEAAVGAVALALALRARKDRLAIVLVTYALGRLVVDTMRGDLARGALGLTPSQLMALGLLAIVVAWRAGARELATSP